MQHHHERASAPMSLVSGRFSLMGLILLACEAVAVGGQYADPSGFSFTYPDGWVPITRAAMGDVDQIVPPKMKSWIAEQNIDLNRIKVILVRDARGAYLANLNFVVLGQQIPVNEQAAKRLTETLVRKYESMGMTVADIKGHVRRYGKRQTIVVEYQVNMPGVPVPLRQMQVVFPGGGKSFLVTCSGAADSFASHRPTFDQILTSVQVPEPLASGPDWDRVAIVAGSAVGAVIGALAVVLIRLSRKSKPKKELDGPAEADER